MRDDSLRLHADESKILGIAAGPLLKTLRKKREGIMRRMFGDFRAGCKDFLPHVAEFAAIEGLISEIEDTERTYLKGEQR